jgi:hypothetical protein
MTGIPAPTLYHRWLGWHAPAMRRAITVLIAGLIVAVALLPFVTWGLALTGGWDAAALTFLLTIWPIIARADSSRAPMPPTGSSSATPGGRGRRGRGDRRPGPLGAESHRGLNLTPAS